MLFRDLSRTIRFVATFSDNYIMLSPHRPKVQTLVNFADVLFEDFAEDMQVSENQGPCICSRTVLWKDSYE